jgi:hypothetical protein
MSGKRLHEDHVVVGDEYFPSDHSASPLVLATPVKALAHDKPVTSV